jgi:hypothetical protein
VTRNFTRTSFAVQLNANRMGEARHTVRLHFAELDAAAPGERVFDILLNGKVAATGVDIAREVGPAKALVKEFRGVVCGGSLDVQLRGPAAPTEKNAPLLSALEIIRE